MCIDFLVVSCIVDLPLLKETLKWSSILFHTAPGTSKDVTNSIVDLLEMLNCGLAQNQIPGKLQEPLLPTGWCSPPHCKTEVLEWLTSKFGDRLISFKTPRPWPAKSPDLSLLDYWFWSVAMVEVRRVQPNTLEELTSCVKA